MEQSIDKIAVVKSNASFFPPPLCTDVPSFFFLESQLYIHSGWSKGENITTIGIVAGSDLGSKVRVHHLRKFMKLDQAMMLLLP